jgi:hypothetical protein
MLGWKYLTWQEISQMPDISIKPGWWSTVPTHYYAKIHYGQYKGRSHNELRFHSDWNWLMDAVEFIENLKFTFITFSAKNYFTTYSQRIEFHYYI